MADITGSDSSETLNGTADNDLIDAKGGNDLIVGSLGSDVIDGGAGLDAVDYSTFGEALQVNLFDTGKSVAVVGAFIKDELYNVENIIGGDAGDYFTGNSSNNIFVGAGGNDYFVASRGVDTYYGGDDFDTVDYTRVNIGVFIDRVGPNQMAAFVNGVPVDRLYGIEQIYASFQDDIIMGTAAAETFYSFGGNDQLHGRGGSDTLIAGLDNDVMSGGKGADRYVFQNEFGNDTVLNFKFRGARHDIIDFALVDTIASFDDLLMNHATSTADGVLIDAGDLGTVLLEGVRINQLAADQFVLFGP